MIIKNYQSKVQALGQKNLRPLESEENLATVGKAVMTILTKDPGPALPTENGPEEGRITARMPEEDPPGLDRVPGKRAPVLVLIVKILIPLVPSHGQKPVKRGNVGASPCKNFRFQI